MLVSVAFATAELRACVGTVRYLCVSTLFEQRFRGDVVDGETPEVVAMLLKNKFRVRTYIFFFLPRDRGLL